MLKPEAGQILIEPHTAALLPADAHAALISPHMASTAKHLMDDRPALAFLDITRNCRNNSTAVAQAAASIPINTPVRHMSVLVGAPGIYGLYLPQDICAPIQELAAKAATAAFYRGVLGNHFIRMQLGTDYRPIFSPDWHQDDMPNIMLCADKIGTMFLMTGGFVDGTKLHTTNNAEIMSTMPGMPISFNKIVHSTPFLDEPKDYKKFGISSVLMFDYFKSNESVPDEGVSSQHIANAVRNITGKSPKPTRYGLLA